jgi:hypothetical protein
LLLKGSQTDFVASKAKHPGLFAGRRAGKTVAGIAKAFSYIGEHPGAVGLITAPITPQIDSVIMPVIEQFFGVLKNSKTHPLGWELREAKREIRFNNGSLVRLRPAIEFDALRGMDLAFFYMDEISSEKQWAAFKILGPSLSQRGFPHQGWVTSTPDWRKPWVKRIWVEHVHPTEGTPMRSEEYKIFQARTQDNVYLEDHHIADQRELYGATEEAEQELEGKFITVEGAAFKNFSYDVHVRAPPPDIEFERTVAGLDFGASSPTSLHELRMDRSKKVWVTREFYKRDAEDYDWVRTAVDWGVTRILCDPARSESELADLRRMYGIPLMRARSKRFHVRVGLLRSRLEIREDGKPGIYISPDCPNLIAEIPNLAYDQPRGQEYTTDRWLPGSQDHAFDSTAYGLMGLDKMLPIGTKPPELKVLI